MDIPTVELDLATYEFDVWQNGKNLSVKSEKLVSKYAGISQKVVLKLGYFALKKTLAQNPDLLNSATENCPRKVIFVVKGHRSQDFSNFKITRLTVFMGEKEFHEFQAENIFELLQNDNKKCCCVIT